MTAGIMRFEKHFFPLDLVKLLKNREGKAQMPEHTIQTHRFIAQLPICARIF